MTLATRAYLAVAAVLVAAYAAGYAWLELGISAQVRANAVRQVERAAKLTDRALAGRPYGDALADSLGLAADVRVTLIGTDGRVLGDSEVSTAQLPRIENHADREEVRAALSGATGTAHRASETVSRALLYVAVPTDHGVLRFAVPYDEVLAPVRQGQRLGLLALFLLLAILQPVCRRIAGHVDARLWQAEEALIRIGAGESADRIDTPGGDPISTLGRTIERVAEQVRERIAVVRRESSDLRALFDGLEDGLAFIDEDGLVGLCNPAFERWAGRPLPPGVRVASLFRTPRIVEAIEEVLAGECVAEELRVGERTVLVTARPHRSGALIALRDLTAARRLEDVRRDFVANVSHELKTPLTSVVGFAEAIADAELPPEQAKGFGQRILANAIRMRNLVEDLLDLARVESGIWRPDRASVSVGEMAREVWSTMASTRPGGATGPGGGILEVRDEGPAAYVDADSLRQILRNLLDNAARYSEDESPVEVHVRAEGRLVRTEVVDHGPGIPTSHIPRVFERFYRVDPARSRERGGTGLGLAIVKHLVEGHGGQVGIDSRLGRGTTVWFTLPLSRET